MAWWFVRGMRRGVVTTRYPRHAAEAWTATVDTPPAFRPEALTRQVADALVGLCPSGALGRDGDDLVYDVGSCTVCGRCLGVEAAVPSGEWELAATRRADLVKRIPIRGDTP
jgi:ferredoxin-like protein FixX